MFVCCDCCLLSGRGLCDELITRPEECYWMWCVVGCDLETSRIRRPWPTGGLLSQKQKKKEVNQIWTVLRHSGQENSQTVQQYGDTNHTKIPAPDLQTSHLYCLRLQIMAAVSFRVAFFLVVIRNGLQPQPPSMVLNDCTCSYTPVQSNTPTR